jgi:hypothetical protein
MNRYCVYVIAFGLLLTADPAQGQKLKNLRIRVQKLKTRVTNGIQAGWNRHKELNQLDRSLSKQIRTLKQQARTEREQGKNPTATRKALRGLRMTRWGLWDGRINNGIANVSKAVGAFGVGVGAVTGGGASLPLGLLNLALGAGNGWLAKRTIGRAVGDAAAAGIGVGPELKKMGVVSVNRDLNRLQLKRDRVEQRKTRHTRWSESQNRVLGSLGKLLIKRDDRRIGKIDQRAQKLQTALDALQPQPPSAP